MSVENVMKLVIDNDIKFVDFRFTDTRGKEQHVTVPVSHLMKTNLQKVTLLTVLLSLAGKVFKHLTCN